MADAEGFFKGFEQKVASSVISESYERSTMDKVTAKEEVQSLRLLMKKPSWTKEDIFEASYLLTSNELKLLYTDDWERYIIGKFFVWLREFMSVEEAIINYQTDIYNGAEIDEDSSLSLEHCRILMENIVKSGIDCYLYITRSSLSIDGKGFNTLTSNNYEIVYPQQGTAVQQNEKKGMFGMLGGR